MLSNYGKPAQQNTPIGPAESASTVTLHDGIAVDSEYNNLSAPPPITAAQREIQAAILRLDAEIITILNPNEAGGAGGIPTRNPIDQFDHEIAVREQEVITQLVDPLYPLTHAQLSARLSLLMRPIQAPELPAGIDRNLLPALPEAPTSPELIRQLLEDSYDEAKIRHLHAVMPEYHEVARPWLHHLKNKLTFDLEVRELSSAMPLTDPEIYHRLIAIQSSPLRLKQLQEYLSLERAEQIMILAAAQDTLQPCLTALHASHYNNDVEEVVNENGYNLLHVAAENLCLDNMGLFLFQWHMNPNVSIPAQHANALDLFIAALGRSPVVILTNAKKAHISHLLKKFSQQNVIPSPQTLLDANTHPNPIKLLIHPYYPIPGFDAMTAQAELTRPTDSTAILPAAVAGSIATAPPVAELPLTAATARLMSAEAAIPARQQADGAAPFYAAVEVVTPPRGWLFSCCR